ncbi:MAG: hypothetical protein ABJB66_09255 [Gemmatimonadaceae bacterium]
MHTSEGHDSSDAAYRFRSGADWFVATDQPDLQVLRLGANSERAIDLFHGLIGGLPDTVDFSMESLRDRLAWKGIDCNRSAVREVIARLKLLLASYGGVEIAAYSADDQLTLTPELEIFIYSRTHRWRSKLLAMGLDERTATPAAVWRPTRQQLKAAPELSDSLASAAQRLGLESVNAELSES